MQKPFFKKPLVKIVGCALLGALLALASVFGIGVVRTTMSKSNAYSVTQTNGYTGVSGEKLLPTELSIDEDLLMEKLRYTLVLVRIYEYVEDENLKDEAGVGMASGIVYRQEGTTLFILTNAHVSNPDGVDHFVVQFEDEYEVEATSIGANFTADTGVLAVDATMLPLSVRSHLTFAEIGDSDAIQVGDLVVTYGNPISDQFSHTITVGVISALERRHNIDNHSAMYYQTDAPFSQGNSGGMLANAQGQILGMTSAKIIKDTVHHIGYIIPINTAVRLADEMIADYLAQ